jgi:transposase
VAAILAGSLAMRGQTRALLAVEMVDVVIPIKPVQRPYCQHPLGGEDPQPQRHQVTDLPPSKPAVTEYQLHRLVCPACGAAMRAEVPAGVPTREFGPRVQAIIAPCTAAYRLSKRATQSAIDDLFGLSMSIGTIANLERATVHALATSVAEARAYVQAPPAAYVDETGRREGRQRAWLWTAVTAWVTVFVVRLSRSAAVAQEFPGRASGDGW